MARDTDPAGSGAAADTGCTDNRAFRHCGVCGNVTPRYFNQRNRSVGYYIVVLSTCQVIFFTESANAMLDSAIPVNFADLVVIFLERTVLLIPLVAIVTHIVFGM